MGLFIVEGGFETGQTLVIYSGLPSVVLLISFSHDRFHQYLFGLIDDNENIKEIQKVKAV